MRIALLDCHKNRLFESEKIARALPCEVELFEVRKFEFPVEEYDAYVISGADGFTEKHVWVRLVRKFVEELIEAGHPILGVCFGNQLLGRIYGYEIVEKEPEIGWCDIELTEEGLNDPLFEGLPASFAVFQHHKKFVECEGGVLARNENGVQAVRYAENVWGMQFHAEETPESGVEFLRNDPKCTDFESAVRLKPEKYIEARVYSNFVNEQQNRKNNS